LECGLLAGSFLVLGLLTNTFHLMQITTEDADDHWYDAGLDDPSAVERGRKKRGE
jgi:hypothetical protein